MVDGALQEIAALVYGDFERDSSLSSNDCLNALLNKDTMCSSGLILIILNMFFSVNKVS